MSPMILQNKEAFPHQAPLYLDYAASTPVNPRVMAQMQACLGADSAFANPDSDHGYGRQARALIEAARLSVAQLIHAVPRNIIFTSGATESINLAMKGVASAPYYQQRGRHLISAATEHPAVLESCAALESQGYLCTYLKPQSNGVIRLADFEAALRPDTILVSLMQVNNETGVLHDIEQMARIARARGILFHVDASQSVGKIPVDVETLGVDLLSVSGHKIYGPKGSGFLYVGDRLGAHLMPQMHGGKQERGMRAGTLATHQIVGLGAACALARTSVEADAVALQQARDQLWTGIAHLPGVYANTDWAHAVSGILNVRFEGIDPVLFQAALGKKIAFSVASACHATALEPSYVLQAMGYSTEQARASIRFSLGRDSSAAQIQQAIDAITSTVMAFI